MAILLKNGAELTAENILKFNEAAAEPFFIGSALKKNILKADGDEQKLLHYAAKFNCLEEPEKDETEREFDELVRQISDVESRLRWINDTGDFNGDFFAGAAQALSCTPEEAEQLEVQESATDREREQLKAELYRLRTKLHMNEHYQGLPVMCQRKY